MPQGTALHFAGALLFSRTAARQLRGVFRATPLCCLHLHLRLRLCLCLCLRVPLGARLWLRACMRACMRACVRACVRSFLRSAARLVVLLARRAFLRPLRSRFSLSAVPSGFVLGRPVGRSAYPRLRLPALSLACPSASADRLIGRSGQTSFCAASLATSLVVVVRAYPSGLPACRCRVCSSHARTHARTHARIEHDTHARTRARTHACTRRHARMHARHIVRSTACCGADVDESIRCRRDSNV